MGAIGTLALKKAAEDGEKRATSSLQLGGVCGVDYFFGDCNISHILVRNFLVAEKEVLKHQGTRTLMYIV